MGNVLRPCRVLGKLPGGSAGASWQFRPWKGIDVINKHLRLKDKVVRAYNLIERILLQCPDQVGAFESESAEFNAKTARGAAKTPYLRLKFYRSKVVGCCEHFIKTRLHRKRLGKGTIVFEDYVDGQFCRSQLCPVCRHFDLEKKRRSFEELMSKLLAENRYKFVFLTLGAGSVRFADLGDRFAEFARWWKKLTSQSSQVGQQMWGGVSGYLRSLAVVPLAECAGGDDGEYDFRNAAYNVHLHCMLAIQKKKNFSINKFRRFLREKWIFLTRLDRPAFRLQPIIELPEHLERARRKTGNLEKTLRQSKGIAVDRVARYILNQNNPFKKDATLQSLVSSLAVYLFHTKRWNYTRSGVFTRFKIESGKRERYFTRTPSQAELDAMGVIFDCEWRSEWNLHHRTSSRKGTIGEIYYNVFDF